MTDEFICNICLAVLIDQLETTCCRTCYCFTCIKKWLICKQTSPVDQQRLTRPDMKAPCTIVRNLLNDSQVTCKYKDRGCNKVMSYDQKE